MDAEQWVKRVYPDARMVLSNYNDFFLCQIVTGPRELGVDRTMAGAWAQAKAHIMEQHRAAKGGA